MSIKIYKQNIKELLDVIDYAVKSKKELPSLILLYSGIDIMAWLGRNESETEVNVYFKQWVKTYLLPFSVLNCNADDLWGARCGIVHRYTAESDVTNKGARQIYYAIGTGKSDDLQKEIDRTSKKGKVVAVHINDLNNSFKIAIQHFDKELSKKHSLISKLVSKRSKKYFTVIPDNMLKSLKP